MPQQAEGHPGRGSATRNFQQPCGERRAVATDNSCARGGGTRGSSEGVGSYSTQRWQAQTFKEDPWHGFVAEGGTGNSGSEKRLADEVVSTTRNASLMATAGSNSTRT